MAQKWEGEEEHRQLQSIMCHARAIIYIYREREREREREYSTRNKLFS